MTNLVEKILTADAVHAGDAHPLFEAHPAPSLLFAPDGLIAHANAAVCTLLRAVPGRLTGAAMSEFFPEVSGALGQTRAPLCHRRVAVRRADGSNFIARVHVTPVDFGPRATLLASIEDLSEFEQEIAAANKEFEAFSSAAGHDLRGPLRILKGFTEALEDECGATLNEEGKTFLKEILKAGDRMEGLIDGLLTFSRAGRAEMSC
jgi:signal transduction histidine kinase